MTMAKPAKDYPHLKEYVNSRGQPVIDYRRNGKCIRLHGPKYTAAFQAEYDAAAAQLGAHKTDPCEEQRPNGKWLTAPSAGWSSST
jgi:hypothetical protein